MVELVVVELDVRVRAIVKVVRVMLNVVKVNVVVVTVSMSSS